MDRLKYCNELNRETFLYGMGYDVISFSYDDVSKRPEVCIHLLRMVLNRFEPAHQPLKRISLVEQEVLRLTLSLARPIRPVDVEKHFQMDHRTSVKQLQRLTSYGWLQPVIRGREERILYYEITKMGLDYGLR